MCRFVKLGSTKRSIWVIAAFVLTLASSACHHDVEVKPQAKVPAVKPSDLPQVQDDDEDAPPKNGHSGT